MKKVLSKITHRDHHAGTTDDHDDFAHVRDHDRDPDDEVLQASLYVDAEPRAPPRVGELPIRGNVMSEPPSSQLPRPRRSSTSATDAEMATGLGQRQRTARGDDDRVDQRHDGDHYPLPPPERGMPTNFSRRTIGACASGSWWIVLIGLHGTDQAGLSSALLSPPASPPSSPLRVLSCLAFPLPLLGGAGVFAARL